MLNPADTCPPPGSLLMRTCAKWLALLLFLAPALAHAQPAAVQVREDRESFMLDNGIIAAEISKRTGDLVSMTYKGIETLSADVGGHSAAYWSHDVTGGVDIVSRITIDPAANGGERAEVSVKGISGGRRMGHGPGTAPGGDFPVDIDIRYSLGRGESGLYTYTAFDHRPDYDGATMAEARIAIELARWFDDIHVDALRSGRYPVVDGHPDKYVHVTRQADERAYGWTSWQRKVGWFLLNPSAEYLSGGPNKAEFTAHGEPTVLNYWKSSHYGGSQVTVLPGERWTRVVGPFMFYVNEGPSHAAMVADAKAQLAREEAKWPYGWVDAEGYAPPGTRSTVTGQLALDDPSGAWGSRYTGKLMVGLTRTPYTLPPPPEADRARMAQDGRYAGSTTVRWQNDGKYLQFWSRNNDPSGRFTIRHVAPGRYTLHAFADGILGEYAKADIVVGEEGGLVDLGRLSWAPASHGRKLWDIGVADRDAREFTHAEHYFEPDVQLRLPELFPDGVTYRIGRSTPGEDWFFAHIPTALPGATVAPFYGVRGEGKATPYRILFDLPQATRGTATLRLAFTSSGSPGIEVAVNGSPVGVVRAPLSDNAILRHQIYGRYSETSLAFDASLLRAGENVLTLTMPAGSPNSGAVYDYLRLELDESGPPPPAPVELTVAPALAGSASPPPPSARHPEPSHILTIHDDARFGLPDQSAGLLRFFSRADASGAEELYVQGAQGEPRRLLAADAVPGRLGVWRASPDGRWLAYSASAEAAPDAFHTINIIDVQTGQPLPDEIGWVRRTAIAWLPDSSGFYYSGIAPPADGVPAYALHEVFLHRLGEPRSADRPVLRSDRPGMVHYAEITEDGRWLVVNGSVNADGKSEINLIDLTRPNSAPFKAIRTMRDRWQFAGSQGDLIYFVTDEGAPNGRLVALDLARPSIPVTDVVAEAAEELQAARIRGGTALLSYRTPSGPVVRERPIAGVQGGPPR